MATMLPQITSPWIFYGLAALYVGYVAYTIFRTRAEGRDEPGREDRGPSL